MDFQSIVVEMIVLRDKTAHSRHTKTYLEFLTLGLVAMSSMTQAFVIASEIIPVSCDN